MIHQRFVCRNSTQFVKIITMISFFSFSIFVLSMFALSKFSFSQYFIFDLLFSFFSAAFFSAFMFFIFDKFAWKTKAIKSIFEIFSIENIPYLAGDYEGNISWKTGQHADFHQNIKMTIFQSWCSFYCFMEYTDKEKEGDYSFSKSKSYEISSNTDDQSHATYHYEYESEDRSNSETGYTGRGWQILSFRRIEDGLWKASGNFVNENGDRGHMEIFQRSVKEEKRNIEFSSQPLQTSAE